MKVKIKKLNKEAIIPSYSKAGDAGMDLTATSIKWEPNQEKLNAGYAYIEYGTGLALEIPEGHVGLQFPRSSVSNTALIMANCVGVIDSGYRGEIKVRFKVEQLVPATIYKVGDRVAQLIIMPYPKIELEEVEELSETERGTGGYGSTGN